ncbi:MAG: hypothetical protein NXI32_13490, partial [bacterium]|nr:hypothetical protein [bacterium]
MPYVPVAERDRRSTLAVRLNARLEPQSTAPREDKTKAIQRPSANDRPAKIKLRKEPLGKRILPYVPVAERDRRSTHAVRLN